MGRHALGCQSVISTDDLEVERGGDPHRVGIDQFLADVGALRKTTPAYHLHGLFSNFGDQSLRLLRGEILSRLILGIPTRCLVKIVQAVAPVLVLLDGDGVDGDQCVAQPQNEGARRATRPAES